MILWVIILVIVLLSVLLSYFSVRSDLQKKGHVKEVQKKLAKGRVVYYAPHSTESSSL